MLFPSFSFSFLFLLISYIWRSLCFWREERKKALPISDLAIAKKYFRPQLVFRPPATTSHSLVSLTLVPQIYSRRDRRSQISQALERNEFGLLFAIDVSIIRGERGDEGENFAWLMMPQTVWGKEREKSRPTITITGWGCNWCMSPTGLISPGQRVCLFFLLPLLSFLRPTALPDVVFDITTLSLVSQRMRRRG